MIDKWCWGASAVAQAAITPPPPLRGRNEPLQGRASTLTSACVSKFTHHTLELQQLQASAEDRRLMICEERLGLAEAVGDVISAGLKVESYVCLNFDVGKS